MNNPTKFPSICCVIRKQYLWTCRVLPYKIRYSEMKLMIKFVRKLVEMIYFSVLSISGLLWTGWDLTKIICMLAYHLTTLLMHILPCCSMPLLYMVLCLTLFCTVQLFLFPKVVVLIFLTVLTTAVSVWAHYTASCLTVLWWHFFEQADMTSELQFGFKAKSSTSQCTFVLKETLAYYVDNKSSVYCAFLDATKAFDRVNCC